MDDWEFMFAAVQKIVQSASSPEDGLQQLLAFAAQNPDQYDEPDYWKTVASTKIPFDTLKSWATAGLEQLAASSGWSLLILDCGDCPDLFGLCNLQLADEAEFEQFHRVARTEALRHFEAYPRPGLFYNQTGDLILADHNVAELEYPLLDWNTDRSGDADWHGKNGEMLWLTVANLALCDVLRDAKFCQSILKGRQKILVISGYEEIFFYVGIISEAGFNA